MNAISTGSMGTSDAHPTFLPTGWAGVDTARGTRAASGANWTCTKPGRYVALPLHAFLPPLDYSGLNLGWEAPPLLNTIPHATAMPQPPPHSTAFRLAGRQKTRPLHRFPRLLRTALPRPRLSRLSTPPDAGFTHHHSPGGRRMFRLHQARARACLRLTRWDGSAALTRSAPHHAHHHTTQRLPTPPPPPALHAGTSARTNCHLYNHFIRKERTNNGPSLGGEPTLAAATPPTFRTLPSYLGYTTCHHVGVLARGDCAALLWTRQFKQHHLLLLPLLQLHFLQLSTTAPTSPHARHRAAATARATSLPPFSGRQWHNFMLPRVYGRDAERWFGRAGGTRAHYTTFSALPPPTAPPPPAGVIRCHYPTASLLPLHYADSSLATTAGCGADGTHYCACSIHSYGQDAARQARALPRLVARMPRCPLRRAATLASRPTACLPFLRACRLLFAAFPDATTTCHATPSTHAPQVRFTCACLPRAPPPRPTYAALLQQRALLNCATCAHRCRWTSEGRRASPRGTR